MRGRINNSQILFFHKYAYLLMYFLRIKRTVYTFFSYEISNISPSDIIIAQWVSATQDTDRHEKKELKNITLA